MKKLLSLAAALLCMAMLSTTAFAADTDALSIYRKYLKNSANITSLDMSVTQRISMVNDGESVDVLKQDIALKMRMPTETDLQMEMRLVDDATKEISTAYFKNNYLYQQVGDEKIKMKMDMEQALASTANVDMNLSEDILKNATIQALADGIKITYKTNLNDVKDGQGHSMADLIKDMDLPEDMKMDISVITSSVTIGYDGMMKSGSNTFGIKVSSGDINLELKVAQFLKVNSVNTVDFIKFPADLASYKLVDTAAAAA